MTVHDGLDGNGPPPHRLVSAVNKHDILARANIEPQAYRCFLFKLPVETY